jgi:hypothetical protein
MGELPDHRPLSRVELILLARLSDREALTKADIKKSLRKVGIPFVGPDLEDCATAALALLASRGLVVEVPSPSTAEHPPAASKGKRRKKPKRGPSRFTRTDAGRVALRSAFGLKKMPSWKETCERVIPALALGELPGEAEADAALASAEAMMATWLRRDRTLGAADTIAQLCDHVIARALGMPAGARLAGIRAYALAKHCGVDSKAEFERIASMFGPTRSGKSKKQREATETNLKLVAADLVQKQLGRGINRKSNMIRELVHHWVRQQDEADGAQRPSAPWPTSLRAVTNATSPATSMPQPGMAVEDQLLTAVQDAIPRVGSDGRYGKENVFVSALWRQLARDQRLPELSLDDFKQWLVGANRDQLVALARADLVDDMDARLVEDSEIEDLGETFHFVIDHRGPLSASGQMHYAR